MQSLVTQFAEVTKDEPYTTFVAVTTLSGLELRVVYMALILSGLLETYAVFRYTIG